MAINQYLAISSSRASIAYQQKVTINVGYLLAQLGDLPVEVNHLFERGLKYSEACYGERQHLR